MPDMSAASGHTSFYIPDNTGNLGDVLTTNMNGGTSWTTPAPAEAPWVTSTKSANYTMIQNKEEILADTSVGAFTITLPGSASEGDRCRIMDFAGSFGAFNLTISPNGTDTINGNATFILNVNYGWVELVSNGSGNWIALV
jgi:hypothetical protein